MAGTLEMAGCLSPSQWLWCRHTFLVQKSTRTNISSHLSVSDTWLTNETGLLLWYAVPSCTIYSCIAGKQLWNDVLGITVRDRIKLEAKCVIYLVAAVKVPCKRQQLVLEEASTACSCTPGGGAWAYQNTSTCPCGRGSSPRAAAKVARKIYVIHTFALLLM